MKTLKLFKRWINMITGKSSFHVQQREGKFYSKTTIKGYYNDLTNKISNRTQVDENGIPVNKTITGLKVYFPISIFQYGLGLFDKYLETKDETYKKSFINIANWAVQNENTSGMWDCMGCLMDKCHETQSSMCQSEGASILFRAYSLTKEKRYLKNALKAIDFMLIDIKHGGTSSYENNELILQEYVSDDNLSVLNGWIFSIFGLYDCTLSSTEEKYKIALNKTVNSLIKELKKYDRKIWSNYDLKGTIASPAYHELHIMQLRVLYDLFGKMEFDNMAKKWERYNSNKLYRIIAMLTKLKQKLFSSKYYDIDTSLVE